MQGTHGNITKDRAIDQIEAQMQAGRHLLRLPLDSHAAVAQANAERSAWQLYNRKLFHHLFSDASMLARAQQSGGLDHEAARSLEWEAARFQRAVMEQIACMAKVVAFLKRLA